MKNEKQPNTSEKSNPFDRIKYNIKAVHLQMRHLSVCAKLDVKRKNISVLKITFDATRNATQARPVIKDNISKYNKNIYYICIVLN